MQGNKGEVTGLSSGYAFVMGQLRYCRCPSSSQFKNSSMPVPAWSPSTPSLRACSLMSTPWLQGRILRRLCLTALTFFLPMT